MIHDPIYTHRTDYEPPSVPQNVFHENSSHVSSTPAVSTMSVLALSERCMSEISHYRRGGVNDHRHCLELLRRATVQRDKYAWECLQQQLKEIVLGWMRQHPKREAACRLDSEENYVTQAFERFWHATLQHQNLEFTTFATALLYLRTNLNGAVLDTLRTYSRLREMALPEPDFPGEPVVEDSMDSDEVWEILQKILSDVRERRLAYLLFHCGLKPREIVSFCPREFDDVHEIYRLRRNIMERCCVMRR
jgi:integrase